MGKAYIYVVDRDFGFAPNPFHGLCTLATCKPGIRKGAKVGDWVIGVGGGRLNATGRCVYAMRVTNVVSFNEYWRNPAFLDKKPIRNGSSRMLVGDNIYHQIGDTWFQLDSHHSNSNGSINLHNLRNDTKSPFVLISRHFYYFGRNAPEIPKSLLSTLGYTNGRNYRVFDSSSVESLINWLHNTFPHQLNEVSGEPFDFSLSDRRYNGDGNQIV